tara:strand:- start:16711 stop:17220 length:510 start_codon:yes stop_codon:yes gene_type:complete
MKRWQGPGHAHAEARRAHEQAEDARYERWKENNPECQRAISEHSTCNHREHVDDMTDVGGEIWCAHCFDTHAFNCEVCGEVHSNEYSANRELTLDESVCTYCDEKCATNKTHHHTPVGISIGHLKYILWTMENAAQDKPYEGTQPGSAKKWLRESIDLIKQSIPKEDGE